MKFKIKRILAVMLVFCMMMGMMLMTGVRIISMMISRRFHGFDHDSFPFSFAILRANCLWHRPAATAVLGQFQNGYSFPIVAHILSQQPRNVKEFLNFCCFFLFLYTIPT